MSKFFNSYKFYATGQLVLLVVMLGASMAVDLVGPKEGELLRLIIYICTMGLMTSILCAKNVILMEMNEMKNNG